MLAKILLEIQRAKRPEEQRHAHGEARVTEAGDDERLLPSVGSRLLAEIKANEQIGAESYAFPAHEHERVVGGGHQRQHHEEEEVQVGEKAIVAALALHVPPGVEVNQKGDHRDRQGHDQSEPVVVKSIIRVKIPGLNPSEVAVDERRRLAGGA